MSYSVPEKPSLDGLEEKWLKKWQESGTYRYQIGTHRDKTYSIDTPPPTVSGSLHIGHVFSYTHTDVIARYKRMNQFSVFYPIGWDDNGVPTERRVQNYYGVRCDPSLPYNPDFEAPPTPGKDQIPVSRRNFVELCQVLTGEDEKAFEDLWRHLGLSVDWDLTYTTVGPHAQRISQAAFLKLIEKGEIYTSEAPTLWDVDFATAVSQAELEDREIEGSFHKIRFYRESDNTEVVIETTRPELIPAVVALVANPKDERYTSLFGTFVYSPMFGTRIPVMAHELAEPDKGSGIAMVCTFGDLTDVTWWKELRLDLRLIVGRDGRLTQPPWGSVGWESRNVELAVSNYSQMSGKPVRRAREIIVHLLEEQGHLVEPPRKITHPVKFYEKGDKPLEVVASRQWFIRTLDHKAELIDLGRQLNWIPTYMRVRYETWVDGLNSDWNVSRQRFFGIPIPVWYRLNTQREVDFANPIFPTFEHLPIDPSQDTPPGFSEAQRNQAEGFIGDPDVMDTWATSSLTPQIATSWLKDENTFNSLFPMDLRPQGQDIIRTWLFYTILRSALEHNKLPWKNTVISGFVLDPDRKKMSKSKGNVVTPMPLLEKHGADALRYWAASGRPGVDTAADEGQLKIGRRMAIKLLNASKFALSIANMDPSDELTSEKSVALAPLDASMFARLNGVIIGATAALDSYDHTKALELCERFFWDFCENYLELVKLRAYGEDRVSESGSRSEHNQATMSARISLLAAVRIMLRLFAPFLPFVSEEVWSWFNDGSIHLASWPSPEQTESEILQSSLDLFATTDLSFNHADPGLLDVVSDILAGIRKQKSEAKRSMKTRVDFLELKGKQSDLEKIAAGLPDLCDAGVVVNYKCTATNTEKIELTITLEPELAI
ncbi:MAG: valine--tRNA ligase [Acidimicrobiaceae bacterium]|nr:valine--tRNA ligase [Acidimicrobiaceae bacterium]